MNPHDIFSLANMTALVMWLLLIIVPNWGPVKYLRRFKVIPVLFSILYVIYIIIMIDEKGMMDFGSLNSVMELFRNEDLVLAGWLHYLAFDLLIGMWILEDNQTTGISHWLIIPCLFLSFMFGPAGFLLYYILRASKNLKN